MIGRSAMLAQCFARHGIARTAIMAATFRSGSSYIGRILGRNGLKGIDQERFNTIADAPDPAMYCERVAERFAGRLFPVKLMWPHRCALARALDLPRERSGEFAASFPGATWMHVTRRDTFRQAISLWRAKQSGRWHVREQGPEPPIDYDFAAIDRAARVLALQDRLWNDFFTCAGVTPLRLVYEDVVADPARLVPVLGAFDLPLIETHVKLRKQADDTSEHHLDRYLNDLYRRGF